MRGKLRCKMRGELRCKMRGLQKKSFYYFFVADFTLKESKFWYII